MGGRVTHWLAALLAAAIAGCAIQQTPAPPIRMMSEAGPRPTPQEAEPVARAHLARALKDPESLKQFAMLDVLYAEWPSGNGWLACFEYNAKNSYGAYGGLTTDGVVVRAQDGRFAAVPGVTMASTLSRCPPPR